MPSNEGKIFLRIIPIAVEGSFFKILTYAIQQSHSTFPEGSFGKLRMTEGGAFGPGHRSMRTEARQRLASTVVKQFGLGHRSVGAGLGTSLEDVDVRETAKAEGPLN